MQVWNVLHAARWKGPKKNAKKSPSGHHRTTLSGYIFAIKARILNRKKLVKQQCLLQMSSQYGELRPTSGWDLLANLGHSSTFQRISRLDKLLLLLRGTLVVGVSQTLRRWIEGATYVRQGDHHVGHWLTFLVYFFNSDFKFFDDSSEFSVTSLYVVFISSSKFMLMFLQSVFYIN